MYTDYSTYKSTVSARRVTVGVFLGLMLVIVWALFVR